DLVNHASDRSQRMILAYPLLRGNVAEHVSLLLIASSHAALDASSAAPLQLFRVFQQPASVPSRKYVHIVAGLLRRSNLRWRSRRKAARGCWKFERIDQFSRPVP